MMTSGPALEYWDGQISRGQWGLVPESVFFTMHWPTKLTTGSDDKAKNKPPLPNPNEKNFQTNFSQLKRKIHSSFLTVN